jgi:hypothetical protein
VVPRSEHPGSEPPGMGGVGAAALRAQADEQARGESVGLDRWDPGGGRRWTLVVDHPPQDNTGPSDTHHPREGDLDGSIRSL